MVVDLEIYKVRKGKTREFEAHVADRLRLLRKTRGFITHSLMRNADDPEEYRSEVRWVSREYRDRFLARRDAEYRDLSEKAADFLEVPPARALLEPA